MTKIHRYVGKLHEISSENSTVALEQVKSFGTEDRHPPTSDTFVPAGDHVYEYIVFRGSDVKDLRIEKEPEKPKQQVPDDPAILGVSLCCPATLLKLHVFDDPLNDEIFRM